MPTLNVQQTCVGCRGVIDPNRTGSYAPCVGQANYAHANYHLSCCACFRCADCGTHIPMSMTYEDYKTWVFRADTMSLTRFLTTIVAANPATFETVNAGKTLKTLVETGHARMFVCQSCMPNRINEIEFDPALYQESEAGETVAHADRKPKRGSAVMMMERRAPSFLDDCGESDRMQNRVYVSVELEAHQGGGQALVDACSKWKATLTTDGSVPEGFEICSSPAMGQKFVDQIEELSVAAQKVSGQVNARCGLHVHTDARDLKQDQLFLMAGLWAYFEPIFYAMMPESRRQRPDRSDGGYCKPIGRRWRAMQALQKPETTISNKLSFLSTGGFGRFESFDGDRYHSLNLMAYGKHKTVECRLHSGTLQASKIIPWASIVSSLNLAVRDRKAADLASFIADKAKTPKQKLFELQHSDEARAYIDLRQEAFKHLNTPSALAALFNPIQDFKRALDNMA